MRNIVVPCLLSCVVSFTLPAFTYASVEAPQDLEVCFSPNEPCEAKLVQFMQSAKKSLHVAIYDINLDSIADVLKKKHKDGLDVKMVVDKVQTHERNSKVADLRRAGIPVKYGTQPKGIMHDKFTIVDGEMLETGSFNYTHHASGFNQENQIYMRDPSVVRRYTERFAKMWSAGHIPADDV